MKTVISQPIYQEAMAINRAIQKLTRGYHSNGTFNLAFKIKNDIISICNELDQGVAARYSHTFEDYYSKAVRSSNELLEHVRIANAARMLKGGFPQELIERIRLLQMKLILVLELFKTEVALDYITISQWARQKVSMN
jgi:four helix bundle protein